MFGNSCQHLWADFIFVMKGKDYIGPILTEKDFMRAGFAFYVPSNAKKRGENSLSFS